MSDWHLGMDYDMWLYPHVDWTSPDYNYELPEPIEAANIEGTLLVNAEDAIEQVRRLQAENDKLRKAMDFQALELGCMTDNRDYLHLENAKLRELCKSMRCALADFDDKVYLAALDETLIGAGFDLQELGVEVDG